jgi:hypothetical protein
MKRIWHMSNVHWTILIQFGDKSVKEKTILVVQTSRINGIFSQDILRHVGFYPIIPRIFVARNKNIPHPMISRNGPQDAHV